MLIGHIAVALGFKKASPRTSLGTLLLASQWSGLLWPILLVFGWQHVRFFSGLAATSPSHASSHPLAHSLLIDFGWALILSGIYLLFRKNRRGAFIVWVCVMSGWLIDFILYRPEFSIYHGSGQLAGIGLWDSPASAFIIEGILFVAGVFIYSRVTRPEDRVGDYAFRSFVGLLVFIYLLAFMTGPVAGDSAVGTAGIFGWILVAWAYWFDQHRTPYRPPAPAIEQDLYNDEL